LLLIVDISTEATVFPPDALKQVDETLATLGFRKEMSTVVRPGRAYSVTYDGPSTDKSKIEDLLRPIAQGNGVTVFVDFDESVRFP